MKLFYKYMLIFFDLSPTSSHLHPLQAENCDSNSRLVVDEDDNVKSGLKGLIAVAMAVVHVLNGAVCHFIHKCHICTYNMYTTLYQKRDLLKLCQCCFRQRIVAEWTHPRSISFQTALTKYLTCIHHGGRK